ncbi:uncharacterized protein LOC110240606 [Exaiptasia diaphana]|uniref:Uncharacterized protein n=1 Tax=Exaiptasia diaphana TaxID=2652724 RepID=A0A913XBL1_EXADI|nr:uncharacterized protein LOC110240606 [Exaiptasia diaphana]
MIRHCSCLDRSCQCGLWGLAQPIFTRIRKHKKVTLCLLQQGRFHGALEYARECGHLGKKELMDAFRLCKSSVVALRLSRRQIPFKSVFTIEEAISILMGSQEDCHLACDLIKKAKKEGHQIVSSAIDKPGVNDNSRETNEKWMGLCQYCLDVGLTSLAEELFAHVIVKMAIAHGKKVHIITRYMLKK